MSAKPASKDSAAKVATKRAYKRDPRHANVPRTKLKRLPKKIVEVEKPPLMIQQKNLSFHELLKRVGLLPNLIQRETEMGKGQGKNRGAHKAAAEEMSHDFESLIVSIAKHGIREKLKVVKTKKGWKIVDGRHRFEAALEVIKRFLGSEAFPVFAAMAQKLADEGLPCEEVDEADAVPIIMDAVNRRHLSKGARAYLAVMMHRENIKEGSGRKSRTECGITAPELATEAGVSLRLMEDALSLHKTFMARADLRQRFEPAIWVGAGLAKLAAGVEAYQKTGQEPDEEPETEAQAKARIAQERIETAMSKWVGVTTAFKHWDTIPKDGRITVIQSGVDAVLALPEEVRRAIANALGTNWEDQV
jgi:hypothetical protein